MLYFSPRFLVLASCCSLLLLAGCGSNFVLLSKDSRIPAGIDLTGFWELQSEGGKSGAERLWGEEKIFIPPDRLTRVNRRRSDSGPSVQVFLEFGNELKISQTEFGLFISYDRSVVEEYTFGENRVVKIGPIEAKRVSGWEGSAFVVETLDKQGATLSEKWQLEADGERLSRKIRINKGEREIYAAEFVFERR